MTKGKAFKILDNFIENYPDYEEIILSKEIYTRIGLDEYKEKERKLITSPYIPKRSVYGVKLEDNGEE
jgi:hypothetical protein